MTATTSVTPNRIAPYLNEPTKTLPPLPASAAGRSALLSDVVFHALVALQGQLAHHDPKVVQKAAEMILDFEQTRLRHGRHIVGTEPTLECGHHAPRTAEQDPPAERAEHTPDPDPPADLPEEPDDGQVEAVRKMLQREADAKGDGEVVSWEQAKQAARDGLTLIRGGFRGDGPHRRAAGATRVKSPSPSHLR